MVTQSLIPTVSHFVSWIHGILIILAHHNHESGNLSKFYGAVVKLHTRLFASALPAISLAPVVSVAV